MKKISKKIFALLLMVLLVVNSIGGVAFAATDLKGHWSEAKMTEWINKGYIKGYPDGTVKPNNKITRAEFMAIVNKAFEFTGGYSASFSDVKNTDWYYSVIATALSKGYIGGYPDGKMKPNAPISRAEAASIISKVANLTADYQTASYYNDKAAIPTWALGAVGAVTKAGIMSGYTGGIFGPNRSITRAETVMALSKALGLQNLGSQVYDTPGSYGSAGAQQMIKGDVSISSANVNLRNMIITGSLAIDKSVANGNVTLTDVQVQGQIYVYGGGSNSVNFDGVKAPTLYVARKDAMVRVVATGSTRIDNTIIQGDAKLEEVALSSNGFMAVRTESDAPSGIDLDLAGTRLDAVLLKAKSSVLNMDSKSVIGKITVSGSGNVINTVQGSQLSYLIADADVTVKGAGTITKADVNANGVRFDLKPTTVNVASGINQPTYLGSSIDTWTPTTGAINVPIASDIVIKFNKKVRLKSGNTDLTNANVDENNLITLKTKNASGTKVSFNASVTVISGKTILTIDPTADLLNDQLYYVSVDGDMLEDYDDASLLGTLSSTFSTIVDGAPTVVSFSPPSGSTNVLVGSNIVITLSEKVRMISGNTELTNTNIDSAVVLRKANVSGENVAFDATVTTVSNKTVITIDPTANLLNNQIYYVAISDDVLEDYSDLRISGIKTTTFTTVLTTAAPLIESFIPAAGAVNVSVDGNLVVTFNKEVRLTDNSALNTTNVLSQIRLFETSLAGSQVVYTPTLATVGGKTVVTLDPTASLKANQLYFLVVSGLEDSLDQALSVSSMTFTTLAGAVTNVNVTGGALTITTPGGTLQMAAEVLPVTVVDKSVVWSVIPGTGSAAISTGGLLTAVSNGTVTIKATSNAHSGIFGECVVTITAQVVPVTVVNITSDQTTISSSAGTIVLMSGVLPTDATDKTLVWSIESGSDYATISSTSGVSIILAPVSNGTVVVIATSNNSIVGRITITITGY